MAKLQAVAQANLDVASLLELKKPTLWSKGEGRCTRALITEAARVVFRGSRVGMQRRIGSPVLEARCGDAEEHQPLCIRETEVTTGRTGIRRGSKYRLRVRDNITPPEGRDPALFTQPK